MRRARTWVKGHVTAVQGCFLQALDRQGCGERHRGGRQKEHAGKADGHEGSSREAQTWEGRPEGQEEVWELVADDMAQTREGPGRWGPGCPGLCAEWAVSS